ncbi:E3 ubiquitin-protein ligase RNF138 [Astyanax mexicanus]|uniref:E3 ubiquitin-protein ligase RNF138 n=1 Tax=Astyanax mexicanus TaxID=7994 RepID=UPI0020CADBD1|nr:E3 ubiquitin-protein ligase RNF138 [Astyanax mexicanus]
MSPESSTADQITSADSEEDYDCPICQEVFKTPVRTKSCRHVFCKSCFETAVKSQGAHCPMCRSPVSEKACKAKDVQQRMRERSSRCRACGAVKFLSKMRLHYKSCRKYKEEYGPISDAPPPPSSQNPVQIPSHSTGFIPIIPVYTPVNSLHSSTLPWMQFPLFLPPASPQPLSVSSAGRVYPCPYCPLEGLRDMALVQHCVNQHAGEIRPAVCPICSQLPWGEPYYCSRNLIGHMRLRHSFSYAGYMNEEEDEDIQVCRALQNSVQDFPIIYANQP